MIHTIIDAAQKRFGLYGLEKTTMKEIASDLNMSKGSLYYYFPDKENLYKSVVEKEQKEFLKVLDQKFEKMDDPEAMLNEYVKIRMSYFRTLLNLSRFRFENFKGIRTVMEGSWNYFYNEEKKIITNILKKGIDKEVFYNLNTNEVAELFLTLLKGLRDAVVKKKDMFYLDQEEYDMLKRKSFRFTELFIKGLKYNR